ncbi:MAG: D-sedoheptulose 7-phosphate isomerase [Chloroflexota bacterium]|nr:D-sedoheptulose 7-phosphate isomerase [Chloroflexota bacterium]
MASYIESELNGSADVLRATASAFPQLLAAITELLTECLETGHKIMLCGNGGSAADAQHVATELLARYKRERRSLPAIALGTDVTFLTAMANDYNFAEVFARQVEGLGQPGDVLWAFSTSGNSENVLRAAEVSQTRGLTRIGFTGRDGGKLRNAVDMCLCIPSDDTPRIQEAHMAVAHVICDLLERAFAE